MYLTDLSYVEESLSTTASHLLQTITQARPSSAIFCAKIRSCSVTPAVASSTSRAAMAQRITRSDNIVLAQSILKPTEKNHHLPTSERRMARRARFTMKNSGPKSTLLFLRIPAVSTNRYTVGRRATALRCRSLHDGINRIPSGTSHRRDNGSRFPKDGVRER